MYVANSKIIHIYSEAITTQHVASYTNYSKIFIYI